MKNFAKRISRAIFLCLAIMIPTMQGAVAQCAMCKASVESNVADGNVSFAAKLNLGILYLFVTPYLLAIVIGYLWYRKSRDNARKLEKIAQRKRRLFGTN